MPTLDPKSLPIGLPWCGKEDYVALVAIMEDARNWPDTWHRFSTRTEKAERSFQDQRQVVRRININPRTFVTWCRKNGVRPSSDACYKFAANISIKEQRNAGGLW